MPQTQPHTGPVPALAPPFADPRLARVASLLATRRFRWLSLDVFDTALSRDVPTPTDVFFVLGETLARRGVLGSASIEGFVRERVQAERRAREAAPPGEVSLEAIYDAYPRAHLEGVSALELVAAERDVERALCHPHPEMASLVAYARALGIRVALVSDTYHRAEDLVALAGLDVDLVLASSEHGVSKFHGLHRVLLSRSGADPAEVLHVGDDAQADVEGPALLGIVCEWFPKFPEGYAEMLGRELPAVYARRARAVSLGDAGLTTLRSRAMAHAGEGHAAWGAGVLGPVLAGFGEWIRARAQAKGVRQVLCLMREGRMLKRVLAHVAPELQAHECFVSRHAALKAAIIRADATELAAFLNRPSARSARELCAELGIDAREIRGIDPDAPLKGKDVGQLVDAIVASPMLSRTARETGAEARHGLMAHLDGLLGHARRGTIGVVDLGYKGTIQAALHRVLAHERPGLALRGFYLVTGGGVWETQASGAAAEGYLADNDQPSALAQTFMRSPEVVEQSLMADVGTTLGHAPNGDPLLDRVHIDSRQRQEIAAVQRGALAFVEMWRQHPACGSADIPARMRPWLQRIVMRAVARPLEVELQRFGHWRHDENFGSSAARTLVEVQDLHPLEASHMSAHQLASLPPSRVYWPFAYAALADVALAEAVAAMHLREVAPAAFAGGAERALVFYWDTGSGFSAGQARVERYRTNARGRVWHRVSFEAGRRGPRAIGMSVGLAGELVAIAGLRVHVRRKGHPTVTTDIGREALQFDGFETLGAGLYRVISDPALAVVETPFLVDADGRVDVDLFFSALGEP